MTMGEPTKRTIRNRIRHLEDEINKPGIAGDKKSRLLARLEQERQELRSFDESVPSMAIDQDEPTSTVRYAIV